MTPPSVRHIVRSCMVCRSGLILHTVAGNEQCEMYRIAVLSAEGLCEGTDKDAWQHQQMTAQVQGTPEG